VEGECHAVQRKLMRPMYTRNAFSKKINVIADTHVNYIKQNHGKDLKFSDFFRRTLSKQLCSALQQYIPTDQEIDDVIYYQLTAENIFGVKKYPEWTIRLNRRYRRAKQNAKNLAKQLITNSATGEKSEYYHQVVSRGQEDNPQWFADGDRRHHALIPMIAGVDTMSATLSSAMYNLLKRPELYARVKEEVDEVLSQVEKITAEHISKLKLCDAVAKETLRLYPATYAMVKTIVKDFEYQGYHFKKGNDFVFFISASHTDERYFKNANSFDVDRYSETRREHRGAALAPFGKGPHTCLGAGPSDIMLPLNIALLVHHCDFDLTCDMNKIKHDYTTPVLSVSTSFKAKFNERASKAKFNERAS